MKRVLFVAFLILMLCSLLLLVNVGTTEAAEPGYSYIEYDSIVVPTLDGVWTSPDEWTDGPHPQGLKISESANFTGTITTTTVRMELLIEFFTDNTNDADDYFQVCMDGTNDGGTAPGDGDFRIEVKGHTTLLCYEGDGTGWTLITPGADVQWANSITATPWSSTPHWILEISVAKTGTVVSGNQPPIGLRVAVYDASNATAGVQAWPPTERDNPSRWGLISEYGGGPIPEGFGFGVMVLLSTVAVAVSFYCLRKRPKTESYSSGKLEK